ncbi:hypothetical protein ACFOY8_14250 [Thalassospira xianhensis]|uniref:Uncharacterized protein n=1 Tax=Thalassospira xianhensis MCCC 1A02616 TaxID=1177929 RepID=A0A367UH93_9PROT|nr:hypothetical protein [Thalassospira xianhensis]RCK07685.1 hypothetical protein TH5_01015 [Thalassospira xianhensis MCCC 1A02616]
MNVSCSTDKVTVLLERKKILEDLKKNGFSFFHGATLNLRNPIFNTMRSSMSVWANKHYVNESLRSLRIHADRAGRQDIRDLLDDPEKGYPAALAFVLEEITCTCSLEVLEPEEIGALTSFTIIADDVERDEESDKVLSVGDVFWADRQAVENEMEILARDGFYDVRFATRGVAPEDTVAPAVDMAPAPAM